MKKITVKQVVRNGILKIRKKISLGESSLFEIRFDRKEIFDICFGSARIVHRRASMAEI